MAWSIGIFIALIVSLLVFRKPIYIHNRYFPVGKFFGLTLWPFIFLRSDYLGDMRRLIRHETIHWQQARSWGVIPWYIFYIAQWLYNLIRYRDAHKAYQELEFEALAYKLEDAARLEYRRFIESQTRIP